MPICKKCGATESFYKSQPSYCKQCMKLLSKSWEKANPERRRKTKLHWQQKPEQVVKRKQRHLYSTYGLTGEGFDRMLLEQGYKCPICFKEVSNKPDHRTHIDHDHATNKVRGVLCRSCNQGIGFLQHDVGILEKAITYLQKT